MTKASDCGTLNNYTSLSTTTAVVSGILILPTIVLNVILIYIIIKVRKGRIPLFYKLLLNIAAADLTTGVIGDPVSVNIHAKEALQTKITAADAYAMHLSLFFTDAVALITMTFLSVDRIAALLYPVKYHNGMKPHYENIIVGMIYPLAIAVVAPYFEINFIKQLAVFSTLNVALAILSLVATITVLQRVGRSKEKNQIDLDPKSQSPENTDAEMKSGNGNVGSKTQKSASLAQIQNKVTKTFLIMVGVFIVMYLPTCVTMIYMNSCGNSCDCFTIHVMRDISGMSILSCSVFRPLIYLLTIRQIREAMVLLCRRQNKKPSTLINSGNTGTASI